MSQTTHLGINGDHHWPRRSNPIRSAVPDEAATHLATVANDLAGVKALLETTLTAVNKLSGEVTRLAAEVTQLQRIQECLVQKTDQVEALSQQLRLQSPIHYSEQVLGPLITSLSEQIDVQADFLAATESDDAAAIEVLKAARDSNVGLLAIYGITIFSAEPGETFDPKRMRPNKPLDASTPKQLVVKRTVRCGWQREQQILRHALVELFIPKSQTP